MIRPPTFGEDSILVDECSIAVKGVRANESAIAAIYGERGSIQLDFFLGTLAPFLRASDRPMAMACLRLVTTPPLPPFPERSVPRFSFSIAFLTLSLAAFPYFATCPPSVSKIELTAEVVAEPSMNHCNAWIKKTKDNAETLSSQSRAESWPSAR